MHNEELYTGIGEENRGKKCTIERGKTPPRRKYDFNEKKMEKIHIKYTNKQNTKKKLKTATRAEKKGNRRKKSYAYTQKNSVVVVVVHNAQAQLQQQISN